VQRVLVSEHKININCNEKINEIVALMLKEKAAGKIILNFDGKGNVTPELVLHNESLYKIFAKLKLE